MNKIKLMADYYCHPLWLNAKNQVGNVDPDTLPISYSLKSELLKWSEKYDSTLNPDDPKSSSFSTIEEKLFFIKEGAQLCAKLQIELGDRYEVTYHP